MVEDTFELMCELEFIDARTGKTASVRMGPPVFDSARGWYYCLSEVAGLEEGGRAKVYGVHALQAIGMCLERFRIVFEKHGGDFRTSEGNSPHMYLPKTIPWGYGSNVYNKLCRMVDDQVQKIEDERTQRRENRSPQDEI